MYMPDTIDINANDPVCGGAYFGALASRYAYKDELRAFVAGLVESARNSTNRHYVVEGTMVKAAQANRFDALGYMSPARVLVSIEFGVSDVGEGR